MEVDLLDAIQQYQLDFMPVIIGIWAVVSFNHSFDLPAFRDWDLLNPYVRIFSLTTTIAEYK